MDSKTGMMKTIIGGIAVTLALGACGNALDIDNALRGAGDITVTLPARVAWEDAHFGTGDGLRATVENTGSRSVYVMLGDAFIGAEEQETLLLAEGGDGYVERREGDSWVTTDRVVLIEGLRTVVLRPGGTYTLIAYVTGEERELGTYRIRIEYYEESDREGRAGEATSNLFEVQ